ncbi:hypothetical protein SNE32_14935 [Lysobacter sp. D1-1-M9]|uniref:hypothetical protein n=1 Tax=Novilysobacter longmucuonensis TaxID=3098603 RepID=UPI002FCC61F1
MSKENAPGLEDGEWELQEQAMRRWSGSKATGHGAAADSYHKVAMALDSMPRTKPPPDFAAQIAMQVACQSPGLDRSACRSLALLLPVLATLLIFRYGGDWWSTAQSSLNDGTTGWILLCAFCIALSWMTILLRDLLSLPAGEARQ